MKGRATLFWIVLVGALGFGLFHVKYKVQTLEDDLRRVNADILREQEQLHVLHAEWAYLNEPRRLEALNERHLGLEPLAADHVTTLEGLPPEAVAAPADAAASRLGVAQ